MIHQILFLSLVVSVLTDNRVIMDCKACGSGACIIMKGGGFSGKEMELPNDSCAQLGDFPA